MSEQHKQDVEILEIVLRNKQHAKVNADYEFGAIRRLLNHVKELEQKRDAALKLADEILIHQVSPLLRDSEWVMGRMDGKRDVANKIRAIFATKDGE